MLKRNKDLDCTPVSFVRYTSIKVSCVIHSSNAILIRSPVVRKRLAHLSELSLGSASESYITSLFLPGLTCPANGVCSPFSSASFRSNMVGCRNLVHLAAEAVPRPCPKTSSPNVMFVQKYLKNCSGSCAASFPALWSPTIPSFDWLRTPEWPNDSLETRTRHLKLECRYGAVSGILGQQIGSPQCQITIVRQLESPVVARVSLSFARPFT